MANSESAIAGQARRDSNGDAGSRAAPRTARNIERRTFEFAVRIVKMTRQLPRDAINQVLVRQIARSGTSIGANVEVAQGSHSRAEFAHRMGIARSEARETLYWLRLLAASGVVKAGRMERIIQESEEIVRILTAIVKKSRKA